MVAKEKKTFQAEENKSNGSLAREGRACVTIVQLGWSIKRRAESQTRARFQKRLKCELRNLTRIWEEMTERPEYSRVPRNVIDQSLTNTILLSFAGMLPSIFTFSSSGKPATVTVLCEYRTACAMKMGLGFLLGNKYGLLHSLLSPVLSPNSLLLRP